MSEILKRKRECDIVWMDVRERERESIYKFGMRESWEKRDLRGD